MLIQIDHADTAYHTKFSCKAELEKKVIFHGWVVWGVGGSTGEMKNKAKLSLEWA